MCRCTGFPNSVLLYGKFDMLLCIQILPRNLTTARIVKSHMIFLFWKSTGKQCFAYYSPNNGKSIKGCYHAKLGKPCIIIAILHIFIFFLQLYIYICPTLTELWFGIGKTTHYFWYTHQSVSFVHWHLTLA